MAISDFHGPMIWFLLDRRIATAWKVAHARHVQFPLWVFAIWDNSHCWCSAGEEFCHCLPSMIFKASRPKTFCMMTWLITLEAPLLSGFFLVSSCISVPFISNDLLIKFFLVYHIKIICGISKWPTLRPSPTPSQLHYTKIHKRLSLKHSCSRWRSRSLVPQYRHRAGLEFSRVWLACFLRCEHI